MIPQFQPKEDLHFIKYLKLFQRTLTDVKLFDGLYEGDEYETYPKDHFYKHELELFVHYVQDESGLISYDKFKAKIRESMSQ